MTKKQLENEELEIDLFAEEEEQEDISFDMAFGDDTDLFSEPTEEEDFSFVEATIDLMEDNDDQRLKLASVFGIDLSSGKESKGMEHSLTKFLIDINAQEATEEEDLAGEIKVSTNFEEYEKRRIADILTGILAFKKDNEIVERTKAIRKQMEENSRVRNQYLSEKKKIEFIAVEEDEKNKLCKARVNILKKEEAGKPLSDIEYEITDGYTLKQAELEFKDQDRKVKRLANNYLHIKESLATCDEVEAQILKEVEQLRNLRTKDLKSIVKQEVQSYTSEMKKVTQVQFGFDLISEEFREPVVAIRCACGHKDVYQYNQLPFYKGGNIYDNFKERSYTDKNIKKNFFTSRGQSRPTETQTKLQRETNAVESRINFPGITSSEYSPLICKNCESYMFFTPDVVDKLVEKGFILDTFSAEFGQSTIGSRVDLTEPVNLFLSKHEVEEKFLADLGLSEYKISKLQKNRISSNINITDDNTETQRLGTSLRISEQALRKYHGQANADLDLVKVQDELESHVENIKLAIKDMMKKYRVPAKSKTLTGPALKRYETKMRKNSAISKLLQNSQGIILKYAIDKKISSKGLKQIIESHEDDISVFKNQITEYLIDFLLDTVIEGETTFVFEEGYARTIEHSGEKLPHSNFFKCYREIIKSYFLFGDFQKVKKDYELSESYKLFRTLGTISKMPDKEMRIAKSEEFVKQFRKTLGTSYTESSNQYFANYMKDIHEFESNFNEEHKCYSWLYYEMIVNNKVIDTVQVADTELFEKLYGEELRSEGHFFLFQV